MLFDLSTKQIKILIDNDPDFLNILLGLIPSDSSALITHPVLIKAAELAKSMDKIAAIKALREWSRNRIDLHPYGAGVNCLGLAESKGLIEKFC
jgi:hypothetical protein